MALLRSLVFVALVASLAAAASAGAQQVDTQKIVAVLQQQRNDALDRAAMAEARLAQANEDVQKLKAELEKLKQKDGNP